MTEDSYLGDIRDPLSLNRYNYALSSPLNYKDPSGHNAMEFLQGGLTLGGSVAMLDTPAPGFADIAGGIIIVGSLAGAGIMYLYEKSTEAEEKKEAEDCLTDAEVQENDKDKSEAPTVEYNGEERSVYRGGDDFTVKSNEVKINPETVSMFGGAYKIESLPEGLKIIQRGARPEHFEIVPEYEMPLETFQGLLNQIVVSGPY